MKKKVIDKKVSEVFIIIGVAVVLAFIVFIGVHVSLTIHRTAVRAARNDRAINGIIGELGGRRAWTDGSYIPVSDLRFTDELWLSDAVVIGDVTIYGSGEVDYPGDVSEAAKEFWEAVIEAFPDIDWGSKEGDVK